MTEDTFPGQPYIFARPYFMLVNGYGQIELKNELIFPFQQLIANENGTFIRLSNGGYAKAGIWQRWNQDFTAAYYGQYLLNLSPSLDSTWIALDSGTMVLNQWIDVRQLVQTNDNGFLLAAINYNERISFTRFDDVGNLLWNKTFPYNSAPFSLHALADGGFFLTGYKGAWAMVCKLDSACNVVWEHLYNPDQTPANVAKGIPLKDGGFFFFYAVWEDVQAQTSDLHFVWMDSAQTIYREQTLFLPFDQWGQEIQQLEDSSIVVSGRTGEFIWGDISDRTFLMKFSPQGDILWVQKYYWQYSGGNLNMDFSPTRDGGFILTGGTFDSTGTSPYMDTWILKVDSVGCPFPGCTPGVGIEPAKTNGGDWVKVFPSPASNILRFRNEAGVIEKGVIRIFSINGKLMDDVIMPMGFQEIGFDVSAWPEGMYIWQYLGESGHQETGRLEILR